MGVIRKQIGVEPLKSHVPGVLPYLNTSSTSSTVFTSGTTKGNRGFFVSNIPITGESTTYMPHSTMLKEYAELQEMIREGKKIKNTGTVISGDTLTWDGNEDRRVCIETENYGNLFLVSTVVPIKSNLIGGTYTYTKNGESVTTTITDAIITGSTDTIIDANKMFVVVMKDNILFDGASIKTKGIYFSKQGGTWMNKLSCKSKIFKEYKYTEIFTDEVPVHDSTKCGYASYDDFKVDEKGKYRQTIAQFTPYNYYVLMHDYDRFDELGGISALTRYRDYIGILDVDTVTITGDKVPSRIYICDVNRYYNQLLAYKNGPCCDKQKYIDYGGELMEAFLLSHLEDYKKPLPFNTNDYIVWKYIASTEYEYNVARTGSETTTYTYGATGNTFTATTVMPDIEDTSCEERYYDFNSEQEVSTLVRSCETSALEKLTALCLGTPTQESKKNVCLIVTVRGSLYKKYYFKKTMVSYLIPNIDINLTLGQSFDDVGILTPTEDDLTLTDFNIEDEGEEATWREIKGVCEFSKLPKTGNTNGDVWHINGNYKIRGVEYENGDVVWVSVSGISTWCPTSSHTYTTDSRLSQLGRRQKSFSNETGEVLPYIIKRDGTKEIAYTTAETYNLNLLYQTEENDVLWNYYNADYIKDIIYHYTQATGPDVTAYTPTQSGVTADSIEFVYVLGGLVKATAQTDDGKCELWVGKNNVEVGEVEIPENGGEVGLTVSASCAWKVTAYEDVEDVFIVYDESGNVLSDGDTLTIDPFIGSTSISLDSTTKWSVECASCKVTPVKGSSSKTLNIRAESEYNGTTLVINYGEDYSSRFTLNLSDSTSKYIHTTPTALTGYSYSGETMLLTVEANVPWVVTPNGDWYDAYLKGTERTGKVREGGSDDGRRVINQVEVKVKANQNTEDRYGVVTFTSGIYKKTVSISQNACPFVRVYDNSKTTLVENVSLNEDVNDMSGFTITNFPTGWTCEIEYGPYIISETTLVEFTSARSSKNVYFETNIPNITIGVQYEGDSTDPEYEQYESWCIMDNTGKISVSQNKRNVDRFCTININYINEIAPEENIHAEIRVIQKAPVS